MSLFKDKGDYFTDEVQWLPISYRVKAKVLTDNAICTPLPFTSDLPFHPLAPALGPPLLHPHSHLQTFAPGTFPTPDFYMALPSSPTSSYHSNITVTARPVLVTLHTGAPLSTRPQPQMPSFVFTAWIIL